MPTTRSPSTRCSASVTRPGGVGEVDEQGIEARAGRLARRWAVAAGTVRRANAMPPGTGRLLADRALLARRSARPAAGPRGRPRGWRSRRRRAPSEASPRSPERAVADAVAPSSASIPASTAPDLLQALPVGVVEHDLVEAGVVPASADQRAVDRRECEIRRLRLGLASRPSGKFTQRGTTQCQAALDRSAPTRSRQRAAVPTPVARSLRAEMAGGRLPAGQRLAPERELCARLGVSRNTLRRALLDLETKGLLTAAGRHGWYVAAAQVVELAHGPRSLTEWARESGVDAGVAGAYTSGCGPPSAARGGGPAAAARAATLLELERVRVGGRGGALARPIMPARSAGARR